MNQPLVSVIMPTFNQAQFIGEAVQSVLDQSHQSLELIIVDNYSDDRTREIVASFQDERVRYLQFVNKGIIAASRNYGVRLAQGKYIAFIDSDDVWLPDKLKRQVEIMEADQQCQMTFCQFKVHSSRGQNDGKVMGPQDHNVSGYLYDKLIRFNFIVSSSVLVKTAVFSGVGYFDEAEWLMCAEDFDLWLRIARHNRVTFLPEIFGMYRMHYFNANVDGQRLQKALRVIDKQVLSGLATQREANRAKANFYFREGWFSIKENVRLARSYFIQALGLNPSNLKILMLSVMGLLISFFPHFYNLLRGKEWDKRMCRFILNHQNL